MDQNVTITAGDRPLNPTERSVAALWSDVLQMAQWPGIDENFFELGGDSMAMVVLELRVQEEFGVDVPDGSLLSAPTIGEFSAFIDSIRMRS